MPIHGTVKRVRKGEVELETGSKFVVVLKPKKAPGKPGQRKQAASGDGYVIKFDGTTITVEVESVKFTPIVEEKKKRE